MYNPKKLIIYLFAYILTTSCGSVEKSIKRGDAALALGEYAEAAGQYKKAYQRTPPKEKALRGKIAFKMGDAYMRYGNAARAAGAFRNAQRYHYTDSLTLYIWAICSDCKAIIKRLPKLIQHF